MDIYVLNKNLERVGIVDNYNSVIWANRYAQRGDCEVYVPATSENLQLMQKGFYLERDDDGMVCQIKKIQLDTDAEDGNYLTVSGYDVKGFLDQRVIWGTATCNGNVEAFNRKLVSDALISPSIEARGLKKENGGQLLSLEAAQEFTEETSEQVSYKNMGEKIRETCQKYGWGYRIFRENSGLKFGFYKGTNRTSEVIFSDEFENLASTTYKSDDTKLGNVALVAGAGEGAERARSVYGYQEGVDRYELFVDAKDVAKNVRYSDLKNAFPLVADGGSGYITTAGGKPVYAVGTLIIRVLDGNQLAWLRAKYPSGTETTVDGVIFFSISDCVIAELLSSAPADGDTVTYRDVVYSAYLLERGYQKVVEYGETESFEGSVIPDITFTYKQDYFLGDIVKVRNEYGIEANARIVEVVEVQDVNGYRIEPKFEYLENGVAEYVEVPTGKAQAYEEGNGSPLADTVENLSDEVDVIKSGYLPLTGGRLTGDLYMPNGYAYGTDGSTFRKLLTEDKSIPLTCRNMPSVKETVTSCFVTFTENFTIENITVPKWSKGIISTTSTDASLIAVASSGNIYHAYRDGSTWRDCKCDASTALFSGTLSSSSGNVKLAYGKKYDRLIVVAQIGLNADNVYLTSITVPVAALTTAATRWIISDESRYTAFYLWLSGNDGYIAAAARSTDACYVKYVYGVS